MNKLVQTIVALVFATLSVLAGPAHAGGRTTIINIPDHGIRYKEIVNGRLETKKPPVEVKSVSEFKDKAGMWSPVYLNMEKMCLWYNNPKGWGKLRMFKMYYYVAKGDTVYTYTVDLDQRVRPHAFIDELGRFTDCEIKDGKIHVKYDPS